MIQSNLLINIIIDFMRINLDLYGSISSKSFSLLILIPRVVFNAWKLIDHNLREN